MVTFDREVIRPPPFWRARCYGRAVLGAAAGWYVGFAITPGSIAGWIFVAAAAVVLLDGIHEATSELILTQDGARLGSLFGGRTWLWSNVARAHVASGKALRASGGEAILRGIGMLAAAVFIAANIDALNGFWTGVGIVVTGLAFVAVLRFLFALLGWDAAGVGMALPAVEFLGTDGEPVGHVRRHLSVPNRGRIRRCLRELGIPTVERRS